MDVKTGFGIQRDNGNMQNKFYPANFVYNFLARRKENLTFH
jgi:hypothetical protein